MYQGGGIRPRTVAERLRVPQEASLCETHPAVSQANPVRIFVTHLWESSDDYLRVFEYLESARNFFYRNYSTPEVRPAGDKEALKEDLRRQIAPVEAVIALSSLYEVNQDLFTFQLLYTQANDKPVVLLKRFGDPRPLPKVLTELASEVVDWDERALVDALRRQARHEETTRWDTIEFKLD
jgi:hypothetical protein